MKKIAIAFGVFLLGYAFLAYNYHQKQAASAAAAAKQAEATPVPEPPLPRELDVDAMAARMKKNREVYEKLRDDTLAAYAALHPDHDNFKNRAAETIRLGAYLWVWGDYYGEDLWATLTDDAGHSRIDYTRADPLIDMLDDWAYYVGSYSKTGEAFDRLRKDMNELAPTNYPAEFKFSCAAAYIRMVADSRANDKENKYHLTKYFEQGKEMPPKAGDYYKELIGKKLPDAILYEHGEQLLSELDGDEESLNAAWTALDGAYQDAASTSPVRKVLEGAYYVDDAWSARGHGWAKDVAESQWPIFRRRMAKASDILTAVYNNSPLKSYIAVQMIDTTLGLENGRDQMEQWFKSAVADDPDSYRAYWCKADFLLPRWYGTPGDLYKFGMECVATGNWHARIPMIFPVAMEYITVDDSGEVYKVPEIWTPLEKIYREYLTRYPEARVYRTKFARSAALGGHWKVAKEQFDLLGDGWSRDVLNKEDYKKFSEQAAQLGAQ